MLPFADDEGDVHLAASVDLLEKRLGLGERGRIPLDHLDLHDLHGRPLGGRAVAEAQADVASLLGGDE